MKSGSPSRTTAAHKTQTKIQAWSSLLFHCCHSSFNPSEAPLWDSRPVSGAGVVHYQLLHRPRSVPAAPPHSSQGHVWIFKPGNNPNTNLKNNTKIGPWAQNQASAMAIPVLWPEPCRKWVRWTEEEKHRHGAVNLKDLEWFWMKEWSLISCQVFSNLIRH